LTEDAILKKIIAIDTKLDQIIEHLNRIDRRLDEIQAK
jgi:hypothetical protein